MHPPHVVIEAASPVAAGHRAAAIGALVAAGLQVRAGFDPRPAGGGCDGTVHTAGDARAALLAALGGAVLVVVATGPRDVVDAFLDDLRRLGPVEHVTADRALPGRLDAAQRALLALLSEGLTLGEAARQLGMARRTADRRLAAARRVLGVRTTAEAVLSADRLIRRGGAVGR